MLLLLGFPQVSDYIIIRPATESGAICEIIVDAHSLVSTPSGKHYVFPAWLGIAPQGFPEFTRLLPQHYCWADRKPVLRSTTELPRLNCTLGHRDTRAPCGLEEIRTPDLRLAKALLYQLSYKPLVKSVLKK